MEKSLRLFFGIALPINMESTMNNLVEALRQRHKQHDSIQWLSFPHLHVTLQFLAAVKIEDVALLATHAREKLLEFSAFELELNELELFPNGHRPKVISVQLSPQKVLATLAQTIGDAVVKTGYQTENRPFRGHLSLARFYRGVKDFPLEKVDVPPLGKIWVDEILLYQSEPGPTGSRYSVLERIKLKSTPSSCGLTAGSREI